MKNKSKKKTNNKLNFVNKLGSYALAFLFFLQATVAVTMWAPRKSVEQAEVLQAATGPTEEFGFWNNSWCKPTEKGVEKKSFYSSSMDTWVGYTIFLPEEYTLPQNSNKTYPVIYFLHGVNGQECNYLSNTEGNPYNLINLINNGEIPPTIVVFPNGGKGLGYKDAPGVCSVTKECPETMIINELIPHIDSTYRTIASRNGRALEGFSMGGQGTMRLGLKYNTLFCSLGILSPATYDNMPEIEGYISNKANDIASNMNFKLAAGEVEGLGSINTINTVNSLLSSAGVPSNNREVSVGSGVGHDLDNLLKATDSQSTNNTIGKRLAQMHWECFTKNGGEDTTPPTPDTSVNAVITTSSTQGTIPLTVQLSGTNSTVQNGSIVEFNWDFGNGTQAKGNEQEITYTAAGTYNVALTVIDTNDNTDIATVTITATEPGSSDGGNENRCRNIRDNVGAVIDRISGRIPRCRIR